MPIETLIAHFNAYIPLSRPEKNALIQRVTEKRVKRRQFILQENDVCKQYTFVVSGCFRMYGVDKTGTEHNIQFAAENDRPAARWIADIGSFHSGKPSPLSIEAMEPSLVLQLDQAN